MPPEGAGGGGGVIKIVRRGGRIGRPGVSIATTANASHRRRGRRRGQHAAVITPLLAGAHLRRGLSAWNSPTIPSCILQPLVRGLRLSVHRRSPAAIDAATTMATWSIFMGAAHALSTRH